MDGNAPADVLVVGAGPTGLALAAQLCAFGAPFRIIDRSTDRVHESRALAVQARTLELFQSLGLGEKLVEQGNPSARLMLHFRPGRPAEVRLGAFGARDTRFPFILFVSQAETEALLTAHLRARGVSVERGVELIDIKQHTEGVRCRLRRPDGREEDLTTRYVAGCDGAHSSVRKLAGIAFDGEAYLQDFLLGDVEIDGGIEPDTLHSFPGRGAVAMLFPLRTPASWRVIALTPGATQTARPHRNPSDALTTSALPLTDLQAAVDVATGGGLRLHSPVWLTHFRLHHRQARHYRVGRVFLAGDAAHIHSPVGAQGMNTGIQDAWNLGWKLALVTRGVAAVSLLDSYEAERWPVGRYLLRYTDRAFGIFIRAMSASRVAAWVRRNVIAHVLPRILRSPRLRARMFRFVAELGIHYRNSPAVADGTPFTESRIRAGDRLPDAVVTCDGHSAWLQQELVGAHLTLLLCGARDAWDGSQLEQLLAECRAYLVIRHLTRTASPGDLVDSGSDVLALLGVRSESSTAQYLIRPDGHVAFRCPGCDLSQIRSQLARVLGRSTTGDIPQPAS